MPHQGNSELIPLGKIGRAHGIRGELRLFAESDAIKDLEEITLELGARLQRFAIQKLTPSKRFWILKLSGLNHRSEAEKWTDALALARREELPSPDEDEFFVHDLLGLHVYTQAETPLGEIVDVYDNGAHDVIVYKTPDNKKAMIPLIEDFVFEINLEERRVIARPLLDEDTE